MSEIKNVGETWMALNTFKCNYLTPLHFKGLSHCCLTFLRMTGVLDKENGTFPAVVGRAQC